MSNSQCKGLDFQTEKMTFNVCYSLVNQSSDRVSIKGIIRPKPSNNETYVFFQFYKENRKRSNSGWILDNYKYDKEDVPYYCTSDTWNFKWSDKPKYDLSTKGKIIFNTFVGEVEKMGSDKPREWKYKMILGFSWGMRSNNGTTIEKIPIRNIPKKNLKRLVNLLQDSYSEANFKTQTFLIRGMNSDTFGMW